VKVTLVLFALAGSLLAADEQREEKRSRVRLGGIVVNAGYGHHSGSPYGWSHWYPYSYWHPYHWGHGPFVGWSHFYHPGYWSGFSRMYGMGEVKIISEAKEAAVLIDGAFAGLAKDLKTVWLEPGAYNIEIRPKDAEGYSKRVYVLSGKTLKLDVKALAEDRP
jgi:hypothetical protein